MKQIANENEWWRERTNDLFSHRILQAEHIFECTFEAVRPQMGPSFAVDKLAEMRTRFPALRRLPSST